jgi:porphobilinogen synthase
MKSIGSYPSTRLRRNRKKEWSRRLVQESTLSPNDLIWPIFICEGTNVKERINTMPGVYRHSIDKLEKLVESAMDKNIPMIALFPNIPNSKKTAKDLRL